jgi:hypothetical protein
VKIEAGSGLSPRWQSDSKDFQRNGFSFKALRSALMAWKTATINSIFLHYETSVKAVRASQYLHVS